MGKYWFTLKPDTFLWIKHGKGLVYNAGNSRQQLFDLSEKTDAICLDLQAVENLYSVELTENDMQDAEIRTWTDAVLNMDAGYLTDAIKGMQKPVSLKPILKVQDGVEYYVWKHKRNIGGDIINHLHELTFYINGSNYGNNEYYKQCLFPLFSTCHLDIDTIRLCILNSRNPFLSKINFAGNFFDYTAPQQLMDVVEEFRIPGSVHILLQDFALHADKLKNFRWPECIRFNIIVDHGIDGQLPPLQDSPFPVSVTAIVADRNEYEALAGLMEKMPVYRDASFIPIYNGRNMDFFKDNVFADPEDLANIHLNRREIFMHQILNTSNFGKLTVIPDGTVYANVNRPPLGTVKDTVYSLIYKEFTEGTSWFRVRNTHPCTECLYQWLCPSPSNYETVTGYSNLCHYNPSIL